MNVDVVSCYLFFVEQKLSFQRNWLKVYLSWPKQDCMTPTPCNSQVIPSEFGWML